MKRLVMIAALTLISLPGHLCAQTEEPTAYEKQMHRGKTDKTFNIWDSQVLIREIVQLKDGKMILDMLNVQDFESFRNLDSVLMNFRRDIAFYKDSLEGAGAGHVRIDYVISPEYTFKKIRFKKYAADGDIFINRGGDVSRLKLEQDTIHIIVEKLLYKSKCTVPYTIQSTFILDNYTDVDKIVADRPELHRILDTLEKLSKNKKEKQDKPAYFPSFSIVYNPYFGTTGILKKYNGLVVDEMNPYKGNHFNKSRYLTAVGGVGGALVTNTLAPSCEAGLKYTKTWGSRDDQNSIMKLYVSSYYFFERSGDGNLSVKNNWFVNYVIGSESTKNQRGWVGTVGDFGVGYLFAQQGDYFKNTTMKFFTDIRFLNNFTVSPELIATNNFKQIFPGVTIKLFEVR